jgi:hypothetical protein
VRSKAYCLIRQQPHYRHESFVAGLKAAGYDVACSRPDFPARRDQVLLIWNRYGEIEQLADRFEADGGTVLVAENGYLGAAVDGKTGIPKQQVAKGIEPQHYYAIARHGHNGSGQTVARWRPRALCEALGLELAPWRTDGRHILVCPNRYFGMKGFIQPQDWDEKTAQRLRKLTGRPVRIRPHPGNGKPLIPLEHDLQDCWAVAVWALERRRACPGARHPGDVRRALVDLQGRGGDAGRDPGVWTARARGRCSSGSPGRSGRWTRSRAESPSGGCCSHDPACST